MDGLQMPGFVYAYTQAIPGQIWWEDMGAFAENGTAVDLRVRTRRWKFVEALSEMMQRKRSVCKENSIENRTE
jgi:hypothetical protein